MADQPMLKRASRRAGACPLPKPASGVVPNTALTPAQERRNILLLGADMALFMGALGLIGPTTLVPLFVSKLTDSPLAIGALTAAFQLGWLSQLLAAGYVERLARKRTWLLVFGVLERLPTLALSLCAMTALTLATPLVLALVYLCRFTHSVAGGPAAMVWLDVVARAVQARRRGRFMGLSTTLGNLLGAGAAALSAPLLALLPFPYSFAACFGLAAVVLACGYIPLFWVIEPPGPPPRAARPWYEHLRELPTVLAGDPPYRRFVAGLAAVALGGMAASFLVVYAARRLEALDEMAAWYTAAVLLGQVAGNLVLGWLGDHRGFTSVGRASALASGGLAAIALAARDPLSLVAAFILLGVGQSGLMLAQLTGPMELAPPSRRPTYIALATTQVSLAAAAAPLIGGALVGALGFEWLFATSLACSLAAVLALGSGSAARQPRPLEAAP